MSFHIDEDPAKLIDFYEAALAKLEWDRGGSVRSSCYIWSLTKVSADTGRKAEI